MTANPEGMEPVSDLLLARLRVHAAIFADNENIMRHWDEWRHYIAKGGKGSLPRDGFEMLIDGVGEDFAEAEATIRALQAQVAERDRQIAAAKAKLSDIGAAIYGRHERGFIMAPLIDPPTLAEAVAQIKAERSAALTAARELTKALVGLTPGGSEYFTRNRVLNEYLADTDACVAAVRRRYDDGHQARVDSADARRRADAAESELSTLRAQVAALSEKLAVAEKMAHYANGVADLAMKHRDAAESMVSTLNTRVHTTETARDMLYSENEQLAARVSELEEGLEPFAAFGAIADSHDWPDDLEWMRHGSTALRVGDLRRARSLTKKGTSHD